MSESDPIRVFPRDGRWLVDYGSYVCAYCETRSQAVAAGTDAARDERRGLAIDDARQARVGVSSNAPIDESDTVAVTRKDLESLAEYTRGLLEIRGEERKTNARDVLHLLRATEPEKN